MSSSAPPRNHWVRRVIVGWALFLGAFGAWGWSGVSIPSAFVSLFACAMMLNASYQLRMAKGRRFSTCVWGAALLLFGAWSGFSAHHAATLGQTDVNVAVSVFLVAFFTASTVIDPFLMWAVADTEKHSHAVMRDEAIANAPNVSPLRQTQLGATAAGAALMAFAAPQPAADALPLTHHEAPQRVRHEAPQSARKAAPQKQTRGASKVRQDIAAVLLQRGAALSPSNREIAAQFKVSPSTVDRIAKAMTPLQDAAA